MEPIGRFPNDFIFGVATAAYQIEGAAFKDGRGASIWDTFSHTPGKVKNGDTGDVACDHYYRWEQDLELIAELGVDAYRFSIAWPRLFPEGRGSSNSKGIAFYDRLIDHCLELGIKVYPTLYHWDLPQALADLGGWTNRDTAHAFAHYAATVMEHYGDRIDAITTFNEPWCSSILSHLYGVHAPGEKNMEQTLKVVHGQHHAHGLALQAMRAVSPKMPMGIVLNAQSVYPASTNDEDHAAVSRHEAFHNGLFFDPLINSCYPQPVLDHLGRLLPSNWQDDMATIAQPLDFWGLNYYTPSYVATDSSPDAEFPATLSPTRDDVRRTDIGWEVDASTLTDLLVRLYQQYALPPCFITENGAAYNHGVKNGVIADEPRVTYMQEHITAVADALDKDVPLKGYFAWSLMDNFEWAEGYDMRFGLIHVDYPSQRRTFKESAKWYQAWLNQARVK